MELVDSEEERIYQENHLYSVPDNDDTDIYNDVDENYDADCSGQYSSLEQFSAIKKARSILMEPIDPPLEFQDVPKTGSLEQLAQRLVESKIGDPVTRSESQRSSRLCCTPEPQLSRRPASRNSLSSRLSSSHNSLSVPTANKADDSSFITSAMSHDVLDMYNVPLDSDIYTLPVDSLRPSCPQRPKRQHRTHRKRRRNPEERNIQLDLNRDAVPNPPVELQSCPTPTDNKRHSIPDVSGRISQPCEPIHMTLQEVRQFLHSLYSSSSSNPTPVPQTPIEVNTFTTNNKQATAVTTAPTRKNRKNTFAINIKNRRSKGFDTDESPYNNNNNNNNTNNKNGKSAQDQSEKLKKTSQTKNSFSYTLKQTLCNIFRFRRPEPVSDTVLCLRSTVIGVPRPPPFMKRALPPLPSDNLQTSADEAGEFDLLNSGEETTMDFASSIEKVKDYGWYWGPISGETAEKILSNEPDGSFIVRDSSDDHYIFSLTFKLNGVVRHVRIEHDQGNFSFGSCTKFKSHTIVEFIENAVEHSRSGRYLFFLHRRPIHGPMRVQLLHPVSRFKQVQSLQHMCRFVILKVVRRDLISSLPLPRRMLDYLNSPHYYSEHPSLPTDDMHPSSSPSLHVFSFMPLNS